MTGQAPQPDPTRFARGGMVCSVDHLASAAGVAVLRDGGTAADAAVAASAVLAVTTQHMCGAGGDLVAVVHPGRGRPQALLAVGRAGSGSDAGRLRADGHVRMPFRDDVRSVTVPGCVDGWLALHAAHGRLPLERVLAPAVAYAEDGFPVSPLLAAALPLVEGVAGAQELTGDRPAAPGDLRRRPALAAALRDVVREGRDGWYGGAFGRGLLAVGEGLFAPADLARDLAEWADPVELMVGDDVLLSTPPPTQGHLVLAGAWVAHRLGALGPGDDPHLLVEAARVTGHDRLARLADGVDPAVLLDPADLAERAERVDAERALDLRVPAEGGGTVYLCAADADGMVVSLSQSNAAGFGAHLGVPEVGVLLHNRGIGFSLEPGHPAELRPGARPPHTLCPAMVLAPAGRARTALGTMGGDAQPQVLLQLLAALAGGASPAGALARPRWMLTGPRQDGFDTWEPWPDGSAVPVVALEADATPGWAAALRALGHRVDLAAPGRGFGHAHVVQVREDGLLAGASDLRAGTGDAQGW